MEEDLKTDTELMQKLSESRTVISIGDKKFNLNEMTIGRSRDFAIKFFNMVEEVQKEIDAKKDGKKKKKLAKMEIRDVIKEYGDIVFIHVTEILNWIFSYKNEEYQTLSVKWIEDNVSIRILTAIVKEIARQSQVDWLLPFFREGFLESLTQTIKTLKV